MGWSANPENYMNNAIAMLLSSKWEGMPNVLIEAMSYACPIISVDCPTGPREILGCSEHGILVSKDNKAGFVDAMLKVEKDKKFWNKWSLKAVKRAKAFSIDTIGPQFLKILGEKKDMCRICGIVSTRKDLALSGYEIEAMRDTMISGGPDGKGLWINKERSVGLGHRRLSIIDLSSAGAQPMTTKDGRYTIVFNGEIYNFRDLKRGFENEGVVFKSDCDTEVLLYAFSKKGIDCLKDLHGMFAFAIWDEKKQTLTLVRDRIGIKPLYYAFQNGIFYFGSELKSIMSNPGFNRRIDDKSLSLFLKYSYVPSPFCILQDCSKLEAGQWLVFSIDGRIEKGAWWNLSNSVTANFDWSDEVLVERELEKRLTKSFEYRMVSDVPVGLFLSGGIDSSLLLALLSGSSGRKLKTFTIGFNEKEFNEAQHAKKSGETFQH